MITQFNRRIFVSLAALFLGACAAVGPTSSVPQDESTPRLSEPAPMLRFWVGYKQADADNATFVEKLNTLLIPELLVIADGEGLMDYLPVVPPTDKPEFLADELALIIYSSEEAYNTIRNTPRGLAYGPMHFAPGLFAKETADGRKSGSLLVGPWLGDAALDKAYFVGDLRSNWQTGVVKFRVLARSSELSDSEYLVLAQAHLTNLAKGQKNHELLSAAVAVTKDSIIEYLRFADGDRASAVLNQGEELEQIWLATIPKQTAGAVKVDAGSGAVVETKDHF